MPYPKRHNPSRLMHGVQLSPNGPYYDVLHTSQRERQAWDVQVEAVYVAGTRARVDTLAGWPCTIDEVADAVHARLTAPADPDPNDVIDEDYS